MYFFIHHDVIFHKRHFFPVGMQETLQQRRRFQRTAEIDALRSIHQFDGKVLLPNCTETFETVIIFYIYDFNYLQFTIEMSVIHKQVAKIDIFNELHAMQHVSI